MKIFSMAWVEQLLGTNEAQDGLAIEMNDRGVGVPAPPISYNVMAGTEVSGVHDVNYIEISNAVSLSAVNFISGSTTTLVVNNTASSNLAVTFSGIEMSPSDRAQEVTSQTNSIYSIKKTEQNIYASLIAHDVSASFPVPTPTDLIILSGQTVTLAAGNVYGYNTIDIQSGGTLVFNDSSNLANLTELYGKNININGSILARSLSVSSTISKTETTVTEDSISIYYAAKTGGAGGNSSSYAFDSSNHAGLGGAGSCCAGGGGGGAPNQNTVYGGNGGTDGGDGQSFTTYLVHVLGGIGSYTSAQGEDGIDTLGVPIGSYQSGGHGGGSGGGASYLTGGGGGGAGGLSGSPLFIYSRNPINGTGIIDLSGSEGFRGGDGAMNYTSGGGGGGGPGGSGGYLVISAPILNVGYSVAAGAGGSAGVTPIANGGVYFQGTLGASGQSGSTGTYTLL